MKDLLNQLGPVTVLLQAFFSDWRTGSIMALIAIDVVSGVMAAIKLGTFDTQKLFTFYRTNVVPGILGYGLVWFFSYFGVADKFGDVAGLLANLTGYGAVVASLTASIIDNGKRFSAPVTQPEVSEMIARPPVNPQG